MPPQSGLPARAGSARAPPPRGPPPLMTSDRPRPPRSFPQLDPNSWNPRWSWVSSCAGGGTSLQVGGCLGLATQRSSAFPPGARSRLSSPDHFLLRRASQAPGGPASVALAPECPSEPRGARPPSRTSSGPGQAPPPPAHGRRHRALDYGCWTSAR
ncbi:modulator of apoptosis 1 isoform X2 [Macaca fascicularis]|uniref:modulator of apoptosis 1 isoform X2 n=1 Tax=Macaca fascicularis TaxID=9541 RepID=UPI003D15D760